MLIAPNRPLSRKAFETLTAAVQKDDEDYDSQSPIEPKGI